MRLDRLDLNLLVALDALFEAQSVSGAARQLNLTQPALTGALNRLREFFQDELLVTSGRTMLLTPRAEELVMPVRDALTRIRNEIIRPRAFEPATSDRHFNLVVSDYSYTLLFADVLADAAKLAPKVTFELTAPSKQALDQLENAQVDLLIIAKDFALTHRPQLDLWRDDDVVLSWDGAGYNTIDADAFYTAGHAVAVFGPDVLALADTYFNEMDRRRRVEVCVPSFSALPQAIVGTRRLATMHRLYAEHFARTYPITLHEPWTPLPPVIITAQWHEIRKTDAGLDWLLDLVKARLETLPDRARLPR